MIRLIVLIVTLSMNNVYIHRCQPIDKFEIPMTHKRMGGKDLGSGEDKYLPDGDVEGNRPTMLHYLMGYYYYLNYLRTI